ncbi:type IV toxin-antitoxin system AbiEi family antitoxin domain-containing protein [Deinococcus oregonensis]|uniref:Type IV toxin-antitoxin system AbiEi family antitoxin domain-containing protein n=1 Tax=Deinococcus oregonensis TaxID=1805970 RepID=A0ABV6AYT6_9DEIO
MTTQPHHFIDWMQRHGGLVSTREAQEAGFQRKALTRLVQQGTLERLERGVYRLVDSAGLSPIPADQLDLLEVQLRFPYARPCLVSALHLHGLTTTVPSRLQFALPANRRALTHARMPLELFYWNAAAYDLGQLDLAVAGRTLTTYTPEKTLVDLLRLSPRFGRELYLEGLKKWLRRPDRDRRALMEAGRALRVWRTLSHDLEVLSHDQDH